MIIKLDENGIAIPDVHIDLFVQTHIKHELDIHVSNELVINCIRSVLVQMKTFARPNIQWIFYGKEVHFDDDLRSHDASTDSRVDYLTKYLFKIMDHDRNNKNH